MTSSVEELLADGEEIQERANPSIMDSGFVKTYVISTVLVIGISVLSFAPINWPFNNLYIMSLMAVPLALILRSELDRRFIKYYITSQKVIERRGVLNQTTESTMYENITDVRLSKDINERVFDVGDLKVNTAGHDGATIMLRGLKDPEQYKRTIENNINRTEGSPQPAGQNFGGGGGLEESGEDFGGGLDDSDIGDDFDDEDFGL